MGPLSPKQNRGFKIVFNDRLTRHCWGQMKKTTPTAYDIFSSLMQICTKTRLMPERVLSKKGPQVRHQIWKNDL
jgi:hypothetical protein